MRTRTILITAGAAVVLVAVPVAVNAATSAKTATCTTNPVITAGASSDSFGVTCSVPRSTTTVTVTQTVTGSPTSSPTSTTVPPTTTPPTTTPPTTTTPGGPLALPRVPWEGGPGYYSQYPGSAGYADPNVFPVAIWYGTFDSAQNTAYDLAHGINTYVQGIGGPSTAMQPGQFYINDGPISGSSASDPKWVGWWTDDEVDGRFNSTDGPARMRSLVAAQGKDCAGTYCRFSYSNYTGGITSTVPVFANGLADTYINNVGVDAVSVDGYYYTDPSCDSSSRTDYQINAPDNAHCATSAAYGNFIRNLRSRDTNPLQPLWGFVENGAPGSNGKYITPEQEAGAVWSMIRNEARGIVWFNSSFSGTCQAGNVIRQAQVAAINGTTNCNTARVEGMKTVNLQVQALAPVLNTQSYVWDFKAPAAETMLKVKDGAAYIFAGVGLNKDPGTSTFTLPSGITGSSVEVVGESRTIPVVGGKFTDTFAKEYTNHIYKIAL